MPRLLVATTIPRTLDDFLLPYARHFRDKGWRVDALSGESFEGTRAVNVFERIHAVRWSRNPLDPRNLVHAPGAIRGLVEREGYDLVHVHTPVASFVTRFALRSLASAKRPAVIYTAHGFHFHPGGSRLRNTGFAALEKLAARWTDYLVVMNREDAASARRLRLVPPDRLREMPGIGLDLGHYSQSNVADDERERLRGELDLTGDDGYFLMVAEFIPRKRHVDLLRAFARVADDPDFERIPLVMAGQGPLLEPMRQKARELGLETRVRFLGQRADIPALIAGAHALVLPSEQEGLPRCVLEAMAVGRPVVATRIRGNTQLLEDGAGYLVEVGDVDGLVAALRGIMASAETSRAMGMAGARRVKKYAIEQLLELHEALYAEALSSRTTVEGAV